MAFLFIWMVTAVGLFATSAAFFSFTGSRDVFHVHHMLQMWTASDSTVINGSNSFLLFCQLEKNNPLGAVSTNGSKSDLAYAVGHVCWEDNESCHLETCQVVNRKGKPSNIFKFF